MLLISGSWAATAAADDLTRITSSFEYKYANPVLTRVSRQFSGGFARADVERLVNELKVLPADQPKTWEFQVRYKGQTYPLQIHVLLDDLGTLDMDFSTSSEIAPRVRTAVDSYINGR
ncbi:MAG: hypothetical protein ABSE43_08385 [Steroidobacteraceae bacterium]|jgi:hypothetical protein